MDCPKHVTVNEALRLLDAAVQLTVQDTALGTPPGSPADGHAWIVAGPASGAWAGWDGDVAYWVDGAWLRLDARPGWRAYSLADDHLHVCGAGGTWAAVALLPPALAAIQSASLIGLGMEASAGTPFAAKLNAALWTALYASDGGTGDLIATLNKEAVGDDLGLILQSAFVTKALIGLFGSDRLRLAVSADGSSFLDGLIIDNATGVVDQPNLPRFKGYTNFDNYVAVDTWTKIAINAADYNDQGAFDAGNNRFTAPVAGTYLFGGSLLFKVNASTNARMRGRLVLNGSTEIRGSFGEISGSHVSEMTALWLQTLVDLDAGDTVELQGTFRAQDGYFAANHTTFWGPRSDEGGRSMTPPRKDDEHLRASEPELEAMLARAAEEGARRALSDIGLGGKDAALTIHDMRSLLECISFVRRTAVQTAVHVITTGVLIALLTGIAMKLRWFGPNP